MQYTKTATPVAGLNVSSNWEHVLEKRQPNRRKKKRFCWLLGHGTDALYAASYLFNIPPASTPILPILASGASNKISISSARLLGGPIV
jgi:hypothetical protein